MQIQPPIQMAPTAVPQATEAQGASNLPSGGFAQVMADASHPRDAATAPQASNEGERHGDAESGDTPDRTAPARPEESRAARLRNAARPARAPHTESKAAPKPSAEVSDGAAADDRFQASAAMADDAAMDPALAQWLAHLHLPPAETATAKPVSDALVPSKGEVSSDPKSPGVDGQALALNALSGEPAAAQTPRASTRHGDRADREAAAVALAPRAAEDITAPMAAAEREPITAPASQAFNLPAGFEATGAVAAPSADQRPIAEGGLASVMLPVPLDSPDFAQAFGVQVSVLARDGVHEAELHLNPAEMGPVSVQIAMDGERARIDFGAQSAATRAAIEAGLPELAAALRDAGLTLSGGGVSQHTPGRGDADEGRFADSPAPGRERTVAAAGTNSRPVWRGRVSPGGVDLYA
jgi:flagellar hook-length control protein FliK